MRLLARLLGASALVVASVVLYGACSLGEGAVPKCDASLPPDDPNACRQVAACDSGNGGVLPTAPCCTDLANRDFGVCAQRDVADYHDECTGLGGGSSGAQCPDAAAACAIAAATYQKCIDGGYLVGTGGTGGVGGSGGNPGGSGGNGGTGG